MSEICKMCGEKEVPLNADGECYQKYQIALRKPEGQYYYLSRILISFTEDPIMCKQCKYETIRDIIAGCLSPQDTRKMSRTERVSRFFDCINGNKGIKIPIEEYFNSYDTSMLEYEWQEKRCKEKENGKEEKESN